MTTSVHHVNTSDATFVQEMIVLLREGVRDGAVADAMALEHTGDPGLRALAHQSSASAAEQIAAMISCLDDWNAESRPRPHPRARIETPVDGPHPARTGSIGYDDELAGLHGSAFDDRVARNLTAHHHAVIDRARQEMIEGLNRESRDLAHATISQHCAELHLLGTWQADQLRAARATRPAT